MSVEVKTPVVSPPMAAGSPLSKPRDLGRGKRPIPALKIFHDIFQRIRNAYELRKYTPETIAEYFRKLGAQIGERCYIIPTDLGTEPYLVRIGNHVAVSQGVVFITHDGAAWVFRDEIPSLQVFGPIVIEDNCFIGARTILCPNIRIGRNSVVGAGSLVISDIPPNSVAIGVPARVWGSREKYRQKCLDRWAQQSPPEATIEPGETWWNSRHFETNREFLKRHLLDLFDDGSA
jgi:acetyltransferase-like isoleucine patch superfamily enzyme